MMSEQDGAPAGQDGAGPSSGAPGEPANTAAGSAGLQFDRAELPRQAAAKCSACACIMAEQYFTINGNVVCPACQQRLGAEMAGGSGTRRFIKAAIFGSLAAVLGCGIYLGVLWGTGYEVGIIAIVVGWMVGKAVNNGSGKRGGWVYQCLAVFLTYTAIVSSYLPLIVKEIIKLRDAEKAATAKAGDAKDAPGKAAAAPAPASKETSSSAVPVADTEDVEDVEDAGSPAPRSLGAVGFIVALFVLMLFAFALPFLAGLQNVVGLFIIGIGLYQAWVMNKRVVLDIKGPFPVVPAVTAEVKPSGA